MAYRASVRPDGHGIWTEAGRRVGFFLEFDNNTMQVPRLVEKAFGYQDLARVYNRAWPVLFSLHSATQERHLHGPVCPTRASGTRWPRLPATSPYSRAGAPPMRCGGCTTTTAAPGDWPT